MTKVALKTKIRTKQNGRCSLTAQRLGKETELFDTDRIIPKSEGGIYTDDNTRVVDPVAHMKRHKSLRERSPELTQLKILIDGREQVRKLLNSMRNRLLAEKRHTDHLDSSTKKWLMKQIVETDNQLGRQDRKIAKLIKSLDMPVVRSMIGLRGLGFVTIAYILVYVDIKKAEHASSLWSYIGIDKPSHERYTKGVTGGGNKTLRTALYSLADSMIRTKAVYRDLYVREKAKLENSLVFVKSRDTKGKLIECMWKDAKPCHRRGAGIRKMMKHFLADLWYVWRTLEGLPTPKLYVEEKLGHKDIIMPHERGWVY